LSYKINEHADNYLTLLQRNPPFIQVQQLEINVDDHSTLFHATYQVIHNIFTVTYGILILF